VTSVTVCDQRSCDIGKISVNDVSALACISYDATSLSAVVSLGVTEVRRKRDALKPRGVARACSQHEPTLLQLGILHGVAVVALTSAPARQPGHSLMSLSH